MSTILSNPAGSKFISLIWMIENKTLKKKKFRQNRFGESTLKIKVVMGKKFENR
jgi:hypothetical protein